MPKTVLRDAMKRPLAAALAAAGVVLSCWGAGCSSQEDRIGFVGSNGSDGGSLAADADAAPPDAGTDAMQCLALECPAPFTTCGDSKYRCDKNLDTDSQNCGGCGIKCPGGGNSSIEDVLHADWRCNSGTCQMSCSQGSSDCNGNPGDGCEVKIDCDPNNCGACGNKCAPGVECILGRCGCAPGLTQCGPATCNMFEDYKICKDLSGDDANCGACGNACPVRNDLPPHMINGCLKSECDHPKCEPGYEDCNGVYADGCEVEVASDPNNCGACAFKCEDGQRCQSSQCLCPPGAQMCTDANDEVSCAFVDIDPRNCGVCGRECPAVPENSGAKGSCNDGHCVLECGPGAADCDGSWTNGCETPTDSDPLNCGGCGVRCDVAAGQPCIRGVCAVQPCEQGPVQ